METQTTTNNPPSSLTQHYLIDTILPAREIHLVAGPSGAGKTRWLLNALKKDWETGASFLGFASHPCKWAYAASDRSMRSVHRTLSDIGIAPAELNIIPAWGTDFKTLPQIFDAAEQMEARLLVIEGFGQYAEEMTPNAIRCFLKGAQTMLEKAEMTIIGVVESPKLKPQERYENPRWRVSGAAAWAHYSETIFLIEPSFAKDIDKPERKLYVCPRNAPGMELKGAFDKHGRLTFHRVI